MRLALLVFGAALLMTLSSFAQPILTAQDTIGKREPENTQPKTKKRHPKASHKGLKADKNAAVPSKPAQATEDDDDEYNRVRVQEMHHSR